MPATQHSGLFELDRLRIHSCLSNVWVVWSLLALAVVGIHLLTIRISPPVWQDEVQILEFGRPILPDSDQSWSATWNPEGRPQRVIPYLGCLIQEIAYRAAGGDLAGPRAVSVLSAIFASAALLGWLRARGLDGRVALAVSMLFLLDPLLSQGYRGARVGGFCMGFMMLALWAIRAMPNHDHLKRPTWKPRFGHVVAAFCVALSGLTWVSAVLLIPLLIHELCVGRNTAAGGGLQRSLVRNGFDLVWIGVLSLFILGLFFLPVLGEIRHAYADLIAMTSYASGGEIGGISGIESLVNSARKCAEAFKYNPWVILVGGILCLLPRRWPLAVALAVAFTAVCLTGIYVHRAVYLLPYLFLSIAFAADKWLRMDASTMRRRLVVVALAAMMLWSAGVTLVARTVVALKQADARDYRHIRHLATHTIGPGPHRVYLGNWEPYYAGRNLGWKLFCFLSETPPGSQVWNDLIKTMDFVIFRTDYLTDQEDEALRNLGFSRERFDCGKSGQTPDPQMRHVAIGYGSYWIYRRP